MYLTSIDTLIAVHVETVSLKIFKSGWRDRYYAIVEDGEQSYSHFVYFGSKEEIAEKVSVHGFKIDSEQIPGILNKAKKYS